uniref:Uncharacterized protein n=1 Tax=Tanacetum cinerariifolium TaxID=118510 RepID=A0A699GX71_TANCI|nr:hypothetical protein [Tanacetum cinerariifolium]
MHKKAHDESSLAKPKTDDDMKIKLSEEFLMELRSNAYYGTYDKDVVEHIANVLEILDLIKTPNEELVEKFFCKFYPISHDGEDEMVSDDDNNGRDLLEFIFRVNSKFKDHRRVDKGTKKALLYSWFGGSWNSEPMDDVILSDEEWDESDYGNPPNTNTDSFFKPYLDAKEKDDIIKGDERSPKKCKGNTSELENIILNKAPYSNKINDDNSLKGGARLRC